MYSYEKSLAWQELFDLAVLDGTPEDDIIAMGYRVAGSSLVLYLMFGRD
jgi:elongator complex protein 1